MNEAVSHQRTFNTRPFKLSEYPLIKSWWTLRKMVPPLLDMMPEESTFVLDVEGKPVASLSLILTNTGTAWLDNFITDPESDADIRKIGMDLAWQEILTFLKRENYSRLFAMSVNVNTKKRYEEFGFKQTLQGVTTMTMEIR